MRSIAGVLTALLALAASFANAAPGDAVRVPPTVAIPSHIPDYPIANLQISSNGQYAVFETNAKLLSIDPDLEADVYRTNLSTGAVELVSITLGPWSSADADATSATISADGRYVAFISSARSLTNSAPIGDNVYVRDMVLGTTTHQTTLGLSLKRAFRLLATRWCS